ncbi:MAG: glycosyltransferase [Ectothiorhodospira sp.]
MDLNTPPRIAIFVATSGHSGVDRVMHNLIPGIAARGYPVDLVKIREHGPYLDPLPPGVRLVDLGARHVYTALPALVRYLRTHPPAVLLSDKDRVNRTALLARALNGASTRVVVRSGTTLSVDLAGRSGLDRWLQTRSVRHLYPRAHGTIVPSVGAAADLARLMPRGADSIHVVPSPIVRQDLTALASAPAQDPWLETRKGPLIVAVGELSRRKDHATLLRAFARLQARRPDLRLAILGRGGQRDALLRQITELGLEGSVHLPGFLSNPYPWMSRARLLAHTARWEGMPVVLVEALSLGIPVVSTDCPSGPREILEDGRLGPLVPIGDDEALAAAMERVLDNPPEPQELRRAAEPYRVERSVTAYLEAMGLIDDR